MIRMTGLSTVIAVFLASVPSSNAQSRNGFWRSEGYGYMFDINGSSLKAFDATTTTCVFDFTAQRDRREVIGREVTFSTKQGDVYFIQMKSTERQMAQHSMVLGLRRTFQCRCLRMMMWWQDEIP